MYVNENYFNTSFKLDERQLSFVLTCVHTALYNFFQYPFNTGLFWSNSETMLKKPGFFRINFLYGNTRRILLSLDLILCADIQHIPHYYDEVDHAF